MLIRKTAPRIASASHESRVTSHGSRVAGRSKARATDILLFHADSISDRDQRALREAARVHGRAVLTAPVYDTIKRVENGYVVETLDRDRLRWPVAWACCPELRPDSDPPAAEWFEGAAVVGGADDER